MGLMHTPNEERTPEAASMSNVTAARTTRA